MFHPVSAYIALRYSTAGKHNSFVSFINGFSVAGIALGLMSLIVVLSVMNGFESQLKQRVLGIVPHIVIPQAMKEQDIQALPGVMASMPYQESEGVIQSRQGLRGVQLQGVMPQAMSEYSVVSEHLVVGQFEDLQPGAFRVMIGRALAVQLDIRPGDTLRVLVAGASVYTPFGRLPSQRLMQVSAIFDVGAQMDDKVVLMHLSDLQKLMRQPAGSVPQTRLFLADAFQYKPVLAGIQQLGFEADDWRSRQGPLFDAVKMEKNMMFLMLLLIIAVAAFNIVSALVMVVSEKQGDIAILQTQGLGGAKIMQVFMLNGLFNGIKGAIIGLVLGVLLATQLNGLLSLFGVPLALSADGQGIPVNLQWGQVVSVTVLSLVLCLLASLYPAIRAMRVQPAQALQND
ncbi:lipoprotein-releasing ABC transporter permease subunit [Alteromonas aestuariivivens]|uniref:Lipoprotein-releasing ABC transporter permease subunit n=1 Tax=Alteromonas aestuariivivens TaxID=1938339 RepID=A0A3D8MCS8_9ALTE|nr:lipoprotein-releasing ABC transporter permease subunit [Alteromonas aestuariivivens]RDV27483.1 lipoprotein-releasing ABC transporter permease subunit [Alteromonas aestuariivivens]